MDVNILRNYLEGKPSQGFLEVIKGIVFPALTITAPRDCTSQKNTTPSLLFHSFLKTKARQTPTVGAFDLAYTA